MELVFSRFTVTDFKKKSHPSDFNAEVEGVNVEVVKRFT
jgi:hypothetical protein